MNRKIDMDKDIGILSMDMDTEKDTGHILYVILNMTSPKHFFQYSDVGYRILVKG
jgi:hypothetical protein